MAEGKAPGAKNFGKVFQKTVSRTREKVLQNLGKADRTQDEDFDIHVNNFAKQQTTAVKLQKELKNYITYLKATSTASKVFYETLRDTYEDGWTGHSDMMGAVEALTNMWEDYLAKLTNQVQDPINHYVSRFPDMKHKVSKRNRKLMDFDGTRHTRDSLANQKKKDETKVMKANDDFNQAKRIYEEINTELHTELPALYENRKSVISSVFNSLFTSEAKFQEESAKIKNTLADATERMNRESSEVFFKPHFNHSPHVSSSDRGSSSSTPPGSARLSKAHIPNDTGSDRDSITDRRSNNGSTSAVNETGQVSNVYYKEPSSTKPYFQATVNGEVSVEPTPTVPATPATPASQALGTNSADEIDLTYENVMIETSVTQDTLVEDEDDDHDKPSSDAQASPPTPKHHENNVITTNNNDQKPKESPEENLYSMAEKTDDIYSVPTSNEPVDKSQDDVLFKVQATHPYAGEDVDELTFELGDIIEVVPFDDPEEQDDGWLMGIRIVSGEKGVFPENFTKRI